MKVFTLILALVLRIQAAPGDEILPGYMVSKDNSMCIKIDTVVADSSGVTAGDAVALNAICTLLSVQEGSAAGQFIVEKQGDNTMQVTLNLDGATTFTSTGTQLTFTPEGTMTALTGITSADVSSLTAMGTSLYVADVGHDTDNTDCLKKDGMYAQAANADGCLNELWYFVSAVCTGMNCKACIPDPAKCSECESNEAKNTAETECLACSGTINCETCSLDSNDDIVCATCGNSKYPTTGGAACDDCGNIIGNCTSCSVNSGTTSCTVCDSEQTPSSDGSTCETTTTAATTTENNAVVEKVSVVAVVGITSLLLTIF